ncbi:hypothetical protein Q5752_002999 [Cryptotrichosporon argae]
MPLLRALRLGLPFARPCHIRALHVSTARTVVDRKGRERVALPTDAAAQSAAKASGDTAPPMPREVERYLVSKLCAAPQWGGDPALARAQARADAAGLPAISVGTLQGQWLSVLARAVRAEKILEIGTLAGYSTIFLSKALPAHGQIDTLEFSEQHAKVAAQNFVDADLFPFPRIHVGPALETLRDPTGAFAAPPGAELGLPADEAGYDLVFIDANKDQSLEYFLEAVRLARRGGTIVLDNAVRQGWIARDPTETTLGVEGLRRVYDWAEADSGRTVLMSATQTVGAKWWDGFAMAVKL